MASEVYFSSKTVSLMNLKLFSKTFEKREPAREAGQSYDFRFLLDENNLVDEATSKNTRL